MAQSSSTFTAEEEKKIQEAIKAQQDQAKQSLIEAEARSRFLYAQSLQPGYKYG